MAEVLEQTLRVKVEDVGLDILQTIPDAAEDASLSIDQITAAYNYMGTKVTETATKIKDINDKLARGILKGEDTKELEVQYKINQSELKRFEGARDYFKDLLPTDDDDDESGLSIRKLAKEISPLTDAVTEIIEINPTIINELNTVVSTMLTGIGIMGALIAVMKLVTQYVKEQTEWDKLNARLTAYGGSSEKALEAFNTIGAKYTKERGGIYSELQYTYGNEDTVRSIIEGAQKLADTRNADLDEILKTFIMAPRTGSVDQILDIAGGNYFETYKAGIGMDARMKYGDANTTALLALDKTLGIIDNHLVNTDVDGLSNVIAGIEKPMRDANRIQNDLASSMTLSKVWGGNSLSGQNLSFNGSNGRSVPVSVINSVMLSSETIDALSDLREHQYMMNINLKHTTPLINQTNNFSNGSMVDTNGVLEGLRKELESANNDGSTLYNDGGLF